MMDYGPHTPYVLAAYAVSIAAIIGLVVWRIAAYRKAAAAEKSSQT